MSATIPNSNLMNNAPAATPLNMPPAPTAASPSELAVNNVAATAFEASQAAAGDAKTRAAAVIAPPAKVEAETEVIGGEALNFIFEEIKHSALEYRMKCNTRLALSMSHVNNTKHLEMHEQNNFVLLQTD